MSIVVDIVWRGEVVQLAFGQLVFVKLVVTAGELSSSPMPCSFSPLMGLFSGESMTGESMTVSVNWKVSDIQVRVGHIFMLHASKTSF